MLGHSSLSLQVFGAFQVRTAVLGKQDITLRFPACACMLFCELRSCLIIRLPASSPRGRRVLQVWAARRYTAAELYMSVVEGVLNDEVIW